MIRNILAIKGCISFFKEIYFSVKNRISQIKILEHPVYILAFIVACVCTLSRAIPTSLFLFILLCFIYLKAFFYLKNNKIKVMWGGVSSSNIFYLHNSSENDCKILCKS